MIQITKRDILYSALKNVISNHVNFSLDGTQLEGKDKVFRYAQVFTPGLICAEYKDAICEGEGLRVIVGICCYLFLNLQIVRTMPLKH